MINKLALFCYRNDNKLKKTFGSLAVLGILTYIVLVVVFSVLKVPVTNAYKAAILAPVGISIISVVCMLIAFLFQGKAEKLPEVILEKARKIKIYDSAIQCFLEQWMERADEGDCSSLIKAWPSIQRMTYHIEAIKPHEKEIEEALKELSSIIAEDKDICFA